MLNFVLMRSAFCRGVSWTNHRSLWPRPKAKTSQAIWRTLVRSRWTSCLRRPSGCILFFMIKRVKTSKTETRRNYRGRTLLKRPVFPQVQVIHIICNAGFCWTCFRSCCSLVHSNHSFLRNVYLILALIMKYSALGCERIAFIVRF